MPHSIKILFFHLKEKLKEQLIKDQPEITPCPQDFGENWMFSCTTTWIEVLRWKAGLMCQPMNPTVFISGNGVRRATWPVAVGFVMVDEICYNWQGRVLKVKMLESRTSNFFLTAIATNLAIWLVNLPLSIRVQTGLHTLMCHAIPFSARALYKNNIIFISWCCGKNQIECGLALSVLLSTIHVITCVAGGIVGARPAISFGGGAANRKRRSREKFLKVLKVLLPILLAVRRSLLAAPLPKRYFAHLHYRQLRVITVVTHVITVVKICCGLTPLRLVTPQHFKHYYDASSLSIRVKTTLNYIWFVIYSLKTLDRIS